MQSNFFSINYYSTSNTVHEVFFYISTPQTYTDFYNLVKSVIDSIVFEHQSKIMEQNLSVPSSTVNLVDKDVDKDNIILEDKKIFPKVVEIMRQKGYNTVSPIKILYKSQNLYLIN